MRTVPPFRRGPWRRIPTQATTGLPLASNSSPRSAFQTGVQANSCSRLCVWRGSGNATVLLRPPRLGPPSPAKPLSGGRSWPVAAQRSIRDRNKRKRATFVPAAVAMSMTSPVTGCDTTTVAAGDRTALAHNGAGGLPVNQLPCGDGNRGLTARRSTVTGSDPPTMKRRELVRCTFRKFPGRRAARPAAQRAAR